MSRLQPVTKLLTPGIGVKRWLLLGFTGIMLIAASLAFAGLVIIGNHPITNLQPASEWGLIAAAAVFGFALVGLAFMRLSRSLLAPYRRNQQGRVLDVVYAHNKRQKGLKVAVIGGGTGLPSVLRGLKQYTSNITAVVTVADDGGSSGRLRREMGVLPPGDLRNNIAALADDESLMTRLFQYRFNTTGELGGHAFGNLFITALAGVTGSIESALIETERVLNIQGRVLPATLEDVNLSALIRLPGSNRLILVNGESEITETGGQIETLQLTPPDAQAYEESVHAILDADLVVIGPGSLFTSILPNLLVRGVAEALRATSAYKIYVCNVATQPGETDNFSVAEHVLALEQHIGRGVFQAVLANNSYPRENAGSHTHYVPSAPAHHEILQRYEVRYADLTDTERPWRHDCQKLTGAILQLNEQERLGSATKPAFTES
ncbi:MAG TPA: uridine diphosphate-N-acetylglucosamine-binding protein YvcK [Phototrophicaceae bacterium]|nr:uridine diphosphate-N-acetylglucosamine-binding protein YvcK [Phototrophicaceae bacterium]